MLEQYHSIGAGFEIQMGCYTADINRLGRLVNPSNGENGILILEH